MKLKRLVTSITASVFLLLGVNYTVAAPNNDATVEQKSVVKTSPETIYFDNMVPLEAQKQTLTITNISGKTIVVSPSAYFEEDYSDLLSTELTVCSFDGVQEYCEPLTDETRIDLSPDESYEIIVNLELIKKVPDDLGTLNLKGGIKVTGEVQDDDKVITIIPDDVEKLDGGLGDTGVSTNVLLTLMIGGTAIILGYIVMMLARRVNSSPTEN